MRRPALAGSLGALLLVVAGVSFARGLNPGSPVTPRAPGPIVKGRARFTVLDRHLIRLEHSAEGGRFVDDQTLFAQRRDTGYSAYSVSEEGDTLVIDTGAIRLTYRDDGQPFGRHNLTAVIRRPGGQDARWHAAMRNTRNLGGATTTLDRVQGPVKLNDGLLSKNGWFVLDDSGTPVLAGSWVRSRTAAERGRDLYLFGYGRDYGAALRAFTRVSGEVPMPRARALGSWYSRYWPHSAEDFRAIAKEYQDRGFPLDVIVQDMDWQTGKDQGNHWTGHTYDPKLIPDPVGFMRWLHENHLSTAVNLHPHGGVAPFEERYPAFMRRMGRDPAKGETLEFDAGSRRYFEAYEREVLGPLKRKGVDWWWLDWQSTHGQALHTRSVRDLTNLAWLNYLLFRNTAGRDLRGQGFSRYGGWGDHRHPLHFSGDIYTNWEALEFEVAMTGASGNQGVFFWTHDIGGHQGDRNEESYARWVQFGATSAALRLHSAREATLDRRPWTYGSRIEASARRAFTLRSELFPYLYTQAWRSHRESLPFLRPMYFAHPNERQAYWNPQQYLLGDHLLVAPVVMAGRGPGRVASQTVWFPRGRWFHWLTGERVDGDRRLLVASDLDEFPLYAQAGVLVPTWTARQRMGTERVDELVLRAFPGEEGRPGASILYEDDGTTQAYARGRHATTDVGYRRVGDRVTMTVGATRGSFAGQLRARAYRFELPATERASEAYVDGERVAVEYDEARRTNVIRLPARPIGAPLTVEVVAREVDPRLPREEALARRLEGLTGAKGETASLRRLIQEEARKGASPLLDGLLELAGIGFTVRNDGPYLYSPTGRRVLEVFSGAHGFEAREVRVLVDGKELEPGRSGRARLPLPSSSGGATVRMSFRLDGTPLTIERTLR